MVAIITQQSGNVNYLMLHTITCRAGTYHWLTRTSASRNARSIVGSIDISAFRLADIASSASKRSIMNNKGFMLLHEKDSLVSRSRVLRTVVNGR